MNIFYVKFSLRLIALVMVSCCVLIACNEEEENPLSASLRVLKASVEGTRLGVEPIVVEKEDLTIEIVFSHTLNMAILEQALTVSNSAEYEIAYDSTQSIIALRFTNLAYETEYALQLPAGTYGAQGEMLSTAYSVSFTTKAFVPPTVTLAANVTALLEGDSALITATLNEPATEMATIILGLGGTAEEGSDYQLSATTLTITEGSTSATATLKILSDGTTEGEEILSITIADLQNAAETTAQELSFSINDEAPALALRGIMAMRWATETDGNSGKAVHLVAVEDIADLSTYGLGVANNGGGSDGVEFTFPAMTVAAGAHILVARDPAALEAYFTSGCYRQFDHVIQSDEMAQNGNDAIELYKGGALIETYGEAEVDGEGQPWEYTGSWAYKLGDTWVPGGVNCTEGATTQEAACTYPLCDAPLTLRGVLALLWDGSGTNGGKALHLVANQDIADLSQFGIGVANNGGGSDGVEYNFPAMAVAAGEHILLAREAVTLSGYFGTCADRFEHVIETDAMNQNGDDAIELFRGDTLIEIFGDVNVDGTGQAWEYSGSWAYKQQGPWIYGGVDCAVSSTSTQNAECVYPVCE